MPSALRPALERLAQNLYLCASAIAQQAALACFEPESLAIYEERRAEFRRRREFFLPALEQLGIGVPVRPDGAFHVYADISRFGDDSDRFVEELLQATGSTRRPASDCT